MPSPLTHGLLPTACAFSTARGFLNLDSKNWKRFLFLCLVLGNIPDIDLIPACLFPEYYHAFHREVGHNIFALCLYIYFGAKAFRYWVSPTMSRPVASMFSAALVFSHVFLDACAEVSPGYQGKFGVPIFWPLSDWQMLMPFPLFGGYHTAHASHPLLKLLLSPEFWEGLVSREAVVILVGSTLWYLAVKTITARRKAISVAQSATEFS